MRFVIFVIDEQSRSASGDEMAAIDSFNQKLRDNGHWVLAAGLEKPQNAQLIDNRNDEGSLKSGSLFNTDDFYSGLWVIEAESLEVASELASAGSKACNRRVELRPFLA